MVDLQYERETKGISQQELATRVGITRQALSAVERGLALPNVENAKKIAEVLGIRWWDFYEESKSNISK